MDNLPSNPLVPRSLDEEGSDQNNNKNNSVPSSFGSNFNPATPPTVPPQPPYQPPQVSVPPSSNPPNTPNLPNNPNTPNSSTYSEVAQHKLRDSHGRFASEHVNPTPQDNLQSESLFKKIITFIIKIKWTKLTLYVGGATTFIYLIISNPLVLNLVNQLFPNSSPILARSVSLQGTLRTSETGIYSLVLPDQQTYTLHFKPSNTLSSLKTLKEVVVKGNLTWTPYVIENAEVYL